MRQIIIYIIIICIPIVGFTEDFIAGRDYELINHQLNQKKPAPKEGIKVTEFFNYGCHWCYVLEPKLKEWLQSRNNKINFSRVAVVFNKDWLYYAKAYYIASLIGQEERLSPELFKAIQEDKRSLVNNQAMIEFFTHHGVENEIAKNAFEQSTLIDLEVSNSRALMAQLMVRGVPAIIINNEYKVDLQMAGNLEQFFKILDFLINKASKSNN